MSQDLGRYKIRGEEVVFQRCPYCGNMRWNFEVNRVKLVWYCWAHHAGGGGGQRFLEGLNLPNIAEVRKAAPTPPRENEESEPRSLFDNTLLGNMALKYLHSRGFSDDEITNYVKGYYDRGKYGGRVVIPLYDCSLTPAYWVARTFLGGKPKYLNPTTKKNDLLGFFTKPSTAVLCTEGALDGIAWRRVVPNVVVMLGKALTDAQASELVARFKQVTVVYDSDTGSEVLALWQNVRSSGVDVMIKSMPGVDADEAKIQDLRMVLNEGPVCGEVSTILRKLL